MVPVLSVLAGVALAACESPLSGSERQRLLAGLHRWNQRGFADYSIEMQILCFCAPEVTSWARVEVVGGAVQRVVILATSEVITDFRLAFWPTVEELFARILSANGQEYLNNVTFKLDPELGFPSFVNWDPDPNVVDAGGTTTLRNPAPLAVTVRGAR